MLTTLFRPLCLLPAVALPALPAAPTTDTKLDAELVAVADAASESFLTIESGRIGLAEDDLITHRGFFVSPDGLAVVPLQAFDHGEVRVVLESTKEPLTIAGLVSADLPSGLAVARTNHKPAKWLPLAEGDAPVGARLAIPRPDRHGGSLAAPVVARRQVAQGRSRQYCEVLSLGANLGGLGGTHVPAGTPVLDAGGQVAGILAVPFVSTRQRFLFAFPASTVASKVPSNAARAGTIPLPLPASLLPRDPLATDPTYLLGRRAQLTGNPQEAERLLRKALARNDKSPGAWERLGFSLRDLRQDEEALAAFRKASEHGNQLAGFELNVADQLRLMKRLTEASQVLQDAAKDIPHDYEVHRAYAIALRLAKDEVAAEKHLRLATKLAPDVISCWELLSKCLAAQGRWDEEKEASDMIYQLESLYRPR